MRSQKLWKLLLWGYNMDPHNTPLKTESDLISWWNLELIQEQRDLDILWEGVI